MCHCHCGAERTMLDDAVMFAVAGSKTKGAVRPQLFTWITILLLAGGLLVVGITADNASIKKPVKSSLSSFLRTL